MAEAAPGCEVTATPRHSLDYWLKYGAAFNAVLLVCCNWGLLLVVLPAHKSGAVAV